MRHRFLAFAIACLACAGALHAESADQRFKSIHEREWAWRLEQFPGHDDEDSTSSEADRRLPSVDPATQKKRLAYWTDVLKQLDGIAHSELSAPEQVNYAIYRAQIENQVADVRFGAYEMPFNSDTQFWSNLGFMTRRPLKNEQAAKNYIAKLDDVPRYFDDQIANMRAGLKRGFSVPRAVLDGREVSIANVANVKSPEDSDFFKPLKTLPASISVDAQQRLRADALRAIRERVIPSYAKLLAFFKNEYVPKARKTLAAEAMPDGKAFYRQQIREYTTLDLDPEDIHRIGLAEVARIDAEMQATMKETGFKGDFPAFLHFLRTDPQFYAKTPEELLMRAAWIAKQVDGKLGQFFGLLPRGRFAIEPVPPAIAPFWTAGRGGVGTYWLNTYDLPSRPLYNLPALTVHESAPGHSFQGALAQEQKDKGYPDFRTRNYISAYGEGWALYCEKLAKEMGLYKTPYEEFGRETYEMWRAARLVIDTGIHHKGWTRDQAIRYLADHTALSRHEVETEVDRYISWPAQALSYKLGEIRIVELRRKAEKELGADFDIRAFHDAVLGEGSVPLPVLEARIGEWIAGRKGSAKEKPASAGKA